MSGASVEKISSRQMQKEATRDSLLNAASEIMIEKDSLDFALSEIAGRINVSPTLIQYHFGGKDGLLMALVERGTERAKRQLAELEELDVPAIKKLRLHVEGLVSEYAKAPYINSLINALIVSSDEARALHVSDIFIKPVAEFHRRLLTQGVSEGVFRDIDPAHFYLMLVGACEHLVARQTAHEHVFGYRQDSKARQRQYAETVFAIISSGILLSR